MMVRLPTLPVSLGSLLDHHQKGTCSSTCPAGLVMLSSRMLGAWAISFLESLPRRCSNKRAEAVCHLVPVDEELLSRMWAIQE